MKIDYAIMSSNSNPYYLDFWPIVSKVWKNEFDINPVLCYVGDDISKINTQYGEVIKFSKIEAIPESSQAQWARFFQTQNYPEKTVLISDIDMIPLSKYYFQDQIELVEEDKYVHLNPCIKSYGHLPACYHVAKGKTFQEVLELDSSWEDSCKFVYELKLGKKLKFEHLNKEELWWFFDELYTHDKIEEYSNQEIFCFLNRLDGQNGRRINRLNWDYNVNLLQENYYFDAHCPRPYSQNKHLIDPLINKKSLPLLVQLKSKFSSRKSFIRKLKLKWKSFKAKFS